MKKRCVTTYTAQIAKALLTAAFFFVLIFFGCRKKQSIDDIYISSRGSQISALPQLQVRILLEENLTNCVFETPARFSITCPSSSILKATFEPTKEPAAIEVYNGRIYLGGWSCTSSEITITPIEPQFFSLNNYSYRGNLRIMLRADANSFDIINQLPIEPYLAGVIGAEMPSYWESAALEAQTIAARTYCLYIQNRFGLKRSWDIRRTQANQVYRGMAAENGRIWQVVNKTKGLVLTCKTADGNYDIFPTYYSSSCAGHTENSANVFGDSYESLVGVYCHYCEKTAKPKDFSWTPAAFKKTYVNKRLITRYPKLKELDGIVSIAPAAASKYKNLERLTKVKLTGSNGKTDFLRAEDLRLAIDPSGFKIKSSSFEIADDNESWSFKNGKGFGHGVGLCQCGAEGLARNKKTAEEILLYYYPNSKIKKIQ